MTLFDTLYAAKEEVIAALSKPSREKMLRRAAERVADELETKKIEAEVKRTTLEHELANTADEDSALKIFKQITDLDSTIEEAAKNAEAVKAEAARLFSKAE